MVDKLQYTDVPELICPYCGTVSNDIPLDDGIVKCASCGESFTYERYTIYSTHKIPCGHCTSSTSPIGRRVLDGMVYGIFECDECQNSFIMPIDGDVK